MSRSLSAYEAEGEFSPEAASRNRVYIMKVGDRIDHVSFRFYGNRRLWELIADYNNIVDVRDIPIGTRIIVPPAPVQRGRYESR